MRPLSIAILVVALAVVTARKPWKQRRERLRCKYDKGGWSECDSETNLVTRVLTLRNGEEGCQVTLNQTISCKKFQKIQEWKTKKMERKNQRQEAHLQRKQERQERKERVKLMKEQRKRCQYDFSDWSECDNTTNTVSRVLTLKDAQEGCEQTHTITLPCAKYDRIQSLKAMKMDRKTERKQHKQEMKDKRKMRKQQLMNCKYDKGDWSECDNATNTVTRVLTLRDTEEGCEPTLEVSISCAKYQRIQAWKAKKMEKKNEKMMEKMQKKEMKNTFKENKKIIKEQQRLGCSFDVSFSECDDVTQMVTKTYTPVGEDESCQSTTISYSCQLHDRLMERKMKRLEKKNDRKRERFESRLQMRLNRKLGRS